MSINPLRAITYLSLILIVINGGLVYCLITQRAYTYRGIPIVFMAAPVILIIELLALLVHNSSAEDEEEDTDFTVIRTKKFPIKPMTTEEAILQMNLLKHTFFVFRNQDDNDTFSVVYRRKSGGYGLIESSDN